jgi:hypothetical protein
LFVFSPLSFGAKYSTNETLSLCTYAGFQSTGGLSEPNTRTSDVNLGFTSIGGQTARVERAPIGFPIGRANPTQAYIPSIAMKIYSIDNIAIQKM